MHLIHGVENPMMCDGPECKCTRTFRKNAEDGYFYCIHCGRMKWPKKEARCTGGCNVSECDYGKQEAQYQTDWTGL